MPAQALRAAPAEAGEAAHHVIALAGTRRHLGSDRLDQPAPLVAQDDRPIERPASLPEIASRTSWSVGWGFRLSNSYAEISIPGVQ